MQYLNYLKGKVLLIRTNHSGEGIFFSSRIANELFIFSDELTFASGNDKNNDYLFDDDDSLSGTTVVFKNSYI